MTSHLTKDEYVFVYGTLMKGLPRSHLLEDCAFYGPAIGMQSELYNLGPYPGIIDGSGIVVGELYQVDKLKLRSLDAVEGYIPGQEPKSLFTRKATTVRLLADGGLLKAVCYYYNRDVGSGHVIPHGDYRRFLLENNETHPWVAAYGSNLDTDRLKSRVGDLNGWTNGSLPGYRLVFNKRQKGGPEVYANIAYRGEGESCPAVAYRLTSDQAKELDKNERGYVRMSLPFNSDEGEAFFVQGYVALPDWLTGNRSPEARYIQHLQIGYREHGLDAGYLDRALAAGKKEH
jgi:gamma-glutamylcyclotransferase (GGCT)/AIG2-like uncharacterized protein YtfP